MVPKCPKLRGYTVVHVNIPHTYIRMCTYVLLYISLHKSMHTYMHTICMVGLTSFHLFDSP